MTDSFVRIYRDQGRVVKCEIVDPPTAEAERGGMRERVIDLPITGFTLDSDVNALGGGSAAIKVHAMRVKVIDRADA